MENLHRQDLNVLEEAAAYQQLIEEFGYTHEQVATRVGKSRTAVTNTLRLLQLPAGVQRLLAEGQISPGHARALLGTPDRGFQEELARSTVAEGLTVRAIEEVVREHDSEAEAGRELGVVQDDGTVRGRWGRGTRDRSRGHQGGRDAVIARTPQLPPPGILELEELLSSHLNTG